MKTHFQNSEIPVEEIATGLKRQVLGYDTNVMMVRHYFEKDVVAPIHQHPHQQVAYIEKGTFEVDVAGKKEVLKQGDCFVVPSNVRHGVICLQEGIIIDAFSPMREDFIKK